jgi:hypothetical protein
MKRASLNIAFHSRLEMTPETALEWFGSIQGMQKEMRPFFFWDAPEQLVQAPGAPGPGRISGRWYGLFKVNIHPVRWELTEHEELSISAVHPSWQIHRRVGFAQQHTWVRDRIHLTPRYRATAWLWWLWVAPLFWWRHYRIRSQFDGEPWEPDWERNYF